MSCSASVPWESLILNVARDGKMQLTTREYSPRSEKDVSTSPVRLGLRRKSVTETEFKTQNDVQEGNKHVQNGNKDVKDGDNDVKDSNNNGQVVKRAPILVREIKNDVQGFKDGDKNNWVPIAKQDRESFAISLMRAQGHEITHEDIVREAEFQNGFKLVILEVDGLDLEVSRSKLISESKFFQDHFLAHPAERRFAIDDYQFEVVQEMINWIETNSGLTNCGLTGLTNSTAFGLTASLDLLDLAAHFQMRQLFDQTQDLLIHKFLIQLSIKNCIKNLIHVNDIKADKLIVVAIKFVLKNWSEIESECPDFSKLKKYPQILIQLLDCATNALKLQSINEQMQKELQN